MRKEIVNIPASIHDKLLNLSRSTNQLFNQLLYIFANERFLYRLGISPHKNKFILKGAMALLNLSLDHPRYTRDMDFLGFTENSVDNIVGIIREICVVEANDDGLIYDLNSISGELIKLSDEYSGVRVMFDAYLGNAVITNLQIDVVVGDVVYPQPREVVLPGLLDLPEAIIRVYPIEAIISEKIHALEMHGFLNSRMKDIYDIWFIASNRIIDGEILTESLNSTFKHRQTKYPELLVIFEENYIDERKIVAWKSIGKKLLSPEHLPDLPFIIDQLRGFLIPLLNALFQGKAFNFIWDPSNIWEWQKKHSNKK